MINIEQKKAIEIGIGEEQINIQVDTGYPPPQIKEKEIEVKEVRR